MNIQTARLAQGKNVSIAILLSATTIGTFIGSLDASIVYISLDKMQSDFGVASQAQIEWVVLGYLLAVISLLEISGYLGDIFSNKLIFRIGMAIFGIGSLSCALAPSLPLLIVFRIFQGAGAAGLTGNTNALITRFTTTRNRGTALGISALIFASAMSIGPVLGGVLVEYLGWRSIFWINVPICAVGLIWTYFAIPPTPTLHKGKKKMDFGGAIFFSVFVTLLIFGLSFVINENISRGKLIGGISLIVSACVLLFFLFWEKKVENPLIDLSLFKNKKIALGLSAAVFAFQGINIVTYQVPFFLQDIKHFSPDMAGLILTGFPLAIVVTSPIAGKLSNHIDAKYLSSAGILGISISLGLICLVLSSTLKIWVIIIISIFMGVSVGFFTAPNTNSVMSAGPKPKLGIVTGMVNLSRNIGFTLGTALSTLIFVFLLNRYQISTGLDKLNPAVYVPSMRIMIAVFAVFALIGATISFLRGPEKRDEHNNIEQNSSSDNNKDLNK